MTVAYVYQTKENINWNFPWEPLGEVVIVPEILKNIRNGETTKEKYVPRSLTREISKIIDYHEPEGSYNPQATESLGLC